MTYTDTARASEVQFLLPALRASIPPDFIRIAHILWVRGFAFIGARGEAAW
jgi:hypothetical protein